MIVVAWCVRGRKGNQANWWGGDKSISHRICRKSREVNPVWSVVFEVNCGWPLSDHSSTSLNSSSSSNNDDNSNNNSTTTSAHNNVTKHTHTNIQVETTS